MCNENMTNFMYLELKIRKLLRVSNNKVGWKSFNGYYVNGMVYMY